MVNMNCWARLKSCPYFYFISLMLVLLAISGNAAAISDNNNKGDEIVRRYQFPQGFLFGAGTSSYQVEGAILEDGKSLSNWDSFTNLKGAIKNGDRGDIADDHYHRYLEDTEIVQSLGVDSYRFSISWSRILPRGKFGSVNEAGIAFYNRLINDLLLKGIKPFVTIHHNDIPIVLEDKYGGWLSPLMQDDYAHFAETCFKNFGDRVKHWATVNEPNMASEMGYMRGIFPPGRCSPPFGNCSAGNSDTEPLIAMHNMLLGHTKSIQIYRDKFKAEQGGIIGAIMHAFMYEPLTDNEHDRIATERTLAFNVGWVFDPLVYGQYPPEMRRYLGDDLPKFTPEETKLIKDSVDFIGINHYSTLYVKDCLYSSCDCMGVPGCVAGVDRPIRGFLQTTPQRDGVFIGEPTGKDRFFTVPNGMEGIVNYVKIRYNNKPMYITENGYSSPIQTKQADLQNDVKRVEYHKTYLASLARAISNGADVRGYFVWSLLDNFEWADGYRVKFGLYGIDCVTLNRLPRLSATWYTDFLKNNNSTEQREEAKIGVKDEKRALIRRAFEQELRIQKKITQYISQAISIGTF